MTEKRYFNTLQRGMTLIELSVVLLILSAIAGLAAPYVGGIGSAASCQTTDATMHAVKEAIMGGAAGAGFYGDTLGLFPAVVKGRNEYSLHFLFSSKNVDGSSETWAPYNAKTAVGWRGPYLTVGASLDTATLGGLDSTFGATFDPAQPTTDAYVHVNMRSFDGADADTTATATEASKLIHVLDAWHRPIVLQIPYNGTKLDTQYARLVSAGPGNGLEPGAAAINTKIQTMDAGDRGDDRVLFLKIPDPKQGGNTPCDES